MASGLSAGKHLIEINVPFEIPQLDFRIVAWHNSCPTCYYGISDVKIDVKDGQAT